MGANNIPHTHDPQPVVLAWSYEMWIKQGYWKVEPAHSFAMKSRTRHRNIAIAADVMLNFKNQKFVNVKSGNDSTRMKFVKSNLGREEVLI